MADVVVVVGAGGEIGAACAVVLSRTHAHVLCVDRDEDAARATAESICSLGSSAEVLVADAGSADFAPAVVSAARSLGPVRSAVHAIAHEEHASAREIEVASVQRSLLLGPVAAFALFQGLHASGGLASDAGLTVIGSLHATHPFANALGYNLAQAALAHLVRTLAHEWAESGVRINAVVPGWIRTRGESALYGDAHLEATSALLPMGRFGTANDIAGAVAYLSSAEAAYVSGAFLTVDGALGSSLAKLPGTDAS